MEEQFYVIFPLIVYFVSIKTLKKITIAILILCPLLRLWGVLYGVHQVTDPYWFGELFYTNTFCQSDALLTGVALAIFDFKHLKPYLTFFATLIICLTAGIAFLVCLRSAGWFLVPAKSLGFDFPCFWFYEKTAYWLVNIRPFYQYTMVNFIAASLILPAINGKPLFPFLFQNKGVAYLGKISYGIYVFHFPILTSLIMLTDIKFGGWYHITDPPVIQISCFILYISIVIFAAHLSYQYFEKRILKFKNHT